MKDNILVKIIAVIVFGLILGTCEFDKNKESIDLKKQSVINDSLKTKKIMVTNEDLDKRLTRLENLHIYAPIILGLGIFAYLIFKK